MIQTRRAMSIAGRYLRGHFKRYLFLLIAMGFGFGIILTMTSLSNGMLVKVSRTARFHYGGDLFLTALPANSGEIGRMDDSRLDMEALKRLLPGGTRLIPRTNFFRDGILYFEGTHSRQKNVFGIDWDAERQELKSMNILEGSLDDLKNDSIMISEPVRRHLNAGVGDRVTLQLKTLTGQVNTKSFNVAAIYSEQNIFGFYRSYVSRKALNRMIGFEDDEYSSLGLYFGRSTPKIQDLAESLRTTNPELIEVSNKEEYQQARNGEWDGYRLFIIPLGVYISEVDDLVQAMRIGSYIVFFMMALIVMVSVMVTYNLIINERLKEIGTLRSIGLQKWDVTFLFFFEGFFLLLIAVVLGALFSLLLNFGISRLSFGWIPGFSLFLENGRLYGRYTPGAFVWNALLLAFILAPAQAIPVIKALQRSIVECL